MAATLTSRSRPMHARLPGVQLAWAQRVPSEASPSGVPVFIGFVAGVDQAPPRVFTDWEPCRAALRGALGYLDYAVRGFFENGGTRCWVLALPLPADADALQARDALLRCLRSGGPLEDLAQPDLVCLPDAGWGALGADPASVLMVQMAALAYCSRMNDRLAILDCLPPGAIGAPGVIRARNRLPWLTAMADANNPRWAGGDVANGALYWPWVQVAPMPRHGLVQGQVVPPCGHVAGVYARLDARQQRHKAPANEVLEGVLDVDDEISDEALAELNEDGANSLRALPGRGVRICAARLLSSHPDWRHVSSRRVVLGLVRWAESGLSDLVMEPHRPALWERIRQRLDSYCLAQYRAGALLGDTPQEAYFVKCDAETNPRESVELGQVVCDVGLAITKPAEFIVVQLVRSADSTVFPG